LLQSLRVKGFFNLVEAIYTTIKHHTVPPEPEIINDES